MSLLSRIVSDPTVEILRAKKESCSMRSGQRVGTGFGSFNKLRVVGVSPYLGFILYLSFLLMFELNEAVRGRLIGPKSWDRIVIIFGTSNGHPVQSTNCLCSVGWKLCIKW